MMTDGSGVCSGHEDAGGTIGHKENGSNFAAQYDADNDIHSDDLRQI